MRVAAIFPKLYPTLVLIYIPTLHEIPIVGEIVRAGAYRVAVGEFGYGLGKDIEGVLLDIYGVNVGRCGLRCGFQCGFRWRLNVEDVWIGCTCSRGLILRFSMPTRVQYSAIRNGRLCIL